MSREIIWFSQDEIPYENSQMQYFSIAEDLKIEKRPIKQRYRYLITDFQKYVKSKKASLKPEDLDLLDAMLVSKFNNLINVVEDSIAKGVFLSQALGVYQAELKKPCDNFSREYRKLLKARDTLGYIPKVNQERVDDAYKAMIAELRKLVFSSVMTLFSRDPHDLPSEEFTENIEVDPYLLKGNPTLAQLYNNVVGLFKSNNINAKVNIVGNKLEITQDEESEGDQTQNLSE